LSPLGTVCDGVLTAAETASALRARDSQEMDSIVTRHWLNLMEQRGCRGAKDTAELKAAPEGNELFVLWQRCLKHCLNVLK